VKSSVPTSLSKTLSQLITDCLIHTTNGMERRVRKCATSSAGVRSAYNGRLRHPQSTSPKAAQCYGIINSLVPPSFLLGTFVPSFLPETHVAFFLMLCVLFDKKLWCPTISDQIVNAHLSSGPAAECGTSSSRVLGNAQRPW